MRPAEIEGPFWDVKRNERESINWFIQPIENWASAMFRALTAWRRTMWSVVKRFKYWEDNTFYIYVNVCMYLCSLSQNQPCAKGGSDIDGTFIRDFQWVNCGLGVERTRKGHGSSFNFDTGLLRCFCPSLAGCELCPGKNTGLSQKTLVPQSALQVLAVWFGLVMWLLWALFFSFM